MNEAVVARLRGLRTGAPRVRNNLTVFPLHHDGRDGPDYLTMGRAMSDGTLIVEEVDARGSVPELAILNRGEKSVLVLDGEEVRGAKQNRVLNTSILIGAGQRIVVPVSCTEAGRWDDGVRAFVESGNLMYGRARSSKLMAVSASLQAKRSFLSDQQDVWRGIDDLGAELSASSPTSAMSDLFQARRESLDDYLDGCPLEEGQCGLLALVGGRVAGLDVLSRPEAYAEVHRKLTASYAMDALAENSCAGNNKEDGSGPDEESLAITFLEAIPHCRESAFPSLGTGEDLRYEGPRLVGSALVAEGAAVHASFFPRPDRRPQPPTIRSASARARFFVSAPGPDAEEEPDR